MSIVVTGVFWILGVLIGALITVATLLKRLKDAQTSPEERDEDGEPADRDPDGK